MRAPPHPTPIGPDGLPSATHDGCEICGAGAAVKPPYTMVTGVDHAEGRVTVEHVEAGQLPPHALRPAEPGDRGYIIDTWLQTYRPHWLRAYGGPSSMRQLESVYWSRFGHVGLIEHLVDQQHITVVGLPEGGPWMYGWACHGLVPSLGGPLHYVFIREEFRGQKLARALLRAIGIERGPFTVTHMTPDFSRGLARGRDVRFVNPYRKAER